MMLEAKSVHARYNVRGNDSYKSSTEFDSPSKQKPVLNSITKLLAAHEVNPAHKTLSNKFKGR